MKIENSIYNYSIDKSNINNVFPSGKNPDYISIYVNKSKSIYLNLDNDSYIGNKDFIKLIKKKSLILQK